MINIDRKETLYSIIKAYPQVKEIMIKLGFKDIVKPGMLQSMGKVMTIEKGARMKGIEMSCIREAFEECGIKLT